MKTEAPRPRPGRNRVTMTLQADPQFHDWVARLAEHSRMPMTVLIEHSLCQFARQAGFDELAPRR